AFKNGKKGVAGLDPDEIIYPNFPKSDITSNLNLISTRVFNYVNGDFWKKYPNNFESINSTLINTLSVLGTFYEGGKRNHFRGFEIVDQNLFTHRSGGEFIDAKYFDYTTPQPMFNHKRPVFYNPSVDNKPLFEAPTKIQFQSDIDNQTFHLNLSVLSPLEGKHYGIPYNQLNPNMRKNP
ncbi:MAG TPA: hypothetical protein DDZ41_08095, partial [Flavobacterium sp.]|nr:hypothetical protein [Flavobacterium sp.]